MKNRIQDQLLFKISILSISVMLTVAPQISAALPSMYNAFPQISSASVETLSTMPNFGIMIGLLLSPFLIKITNERKTIITGLIIAMFAGTFPMFSKSYWLILASRFLLGVGIGLFNSLAVSLLARFYHKDKLSSMLGYQNAMANVGGACFAFLVSYLVVLGWHAVFTIYWVALPVLLLFIFFVPLKEDQQEHTEILVHHEKQRLNKSVIGISILMFFSFLFYMPITFKLPQLVVGEKIGTMSEVSVLSGFLTLVGIPVGISYGFFRRHLRSKLMPIGFFLITLGMFMVALGTNIVALFISIIIVGVGFGLSVPYIYNWLDEVAPVNSINLATTIVLIVLNIGCFVSPAVVNFLSSIMGNDNPQTALLISAIAFAVMFVYTLVHYLLSQYNVIKPTANERTVKIPQAK